MKSTKRLFLVLAILATIALGLWYHLRSSPAGSQAAAKEKMGPVAPLHGISFPQKPPVLTSTLIKGNFKLHYSTDEFPPSLRVVYGIGKNGMWSGMRNPGQQFQTDDVIRESDIPATRLVLAAERPSDNLWITEYEFGGRAPGTAVDFFAIGPQVPVPEWTCRLERPLGTIEGLRLAVSEGTCRSVPKS